VHSVKRRLLEEEDKLGSDLELLDEMRKTITNLNALIETQRTFVAVLEKNDEYSPRARALLDGPKADRGGGQSSHQTTETMFAL
jgi:hypothetical protein